MSIEITERPLITFALFAYNQEKYVREAVEGAFSQTYSPLEIILSDDCSGDRTFEVIREMASAYHGPHRIILNRNDRNLGIPGHVNRVMELAAGEIIVAAAGDDISLAERCSRTVELWEVNRRVPSFLSFRFISFADGVNGPLKRSPRPRYDVHEVIREADPYVTGATCAWHKRLFEVFGPLPEFLYEEDVLLAFRALILSDIAHADIPVVLKREHLGNTLSSHHPMYQGPRGQLLRSQQLLRRRIAALRAFGLTVQQAVENGVLSPQRARELQGEIDLAIRARQLELDLNDHKFIVRLRAALNLWTTPTVRKFSVRRKLFNLVTVFTPSLRETIRGAYGHKGLR